jgi:hypothetical protein
MMMLRYSIPLPMFHECSKPFEEVTIRLSPRSWITTGLSQESQNTRGSSVSEYYIQTVQFGLLALQ